MDSDVLMFWISDGMATIGRRAVAGVHFAKSWQDYLQASLEGRTNKDMVSAVDTTGYGGVNHHTGALAIAFMGFKAVGSRGLSCNQWLHNTCSVFIIVTQPVLPLHRHVLTLCVTIPTTTLWTGVHYTRDAGQCGREANTG